MLTEKKKRFAEEYIVDLNATQSAIRAGYSAKTAYSAGQRLLKDVDVQAAVTAAQQKRSERTAITADYVLQGIQEVAERCLQRAPVMVGRGEDRAQATDDDGNAVWEFDAAGANKAFELLGKHLKLFTEKVDHSSSDGTMSPPTLDQFYGALRSAQSQSNG